MEMSLQREMTCNLELVYKGFTTVTEQHTCHPSTRVAERAGGWEAGRRVTQQSPGQHGFTRQTWPHTTQPCRAQLTRMLVGKGMEHLSGVRVRIYTDMRTLNTNKKTIYSLHCKTEELQCFRALLFLLFV